jgi:carbonic anhydrase/acetyltransferase-like protein (isoleucine patch superfamily)
MPAPLYAFRTILPTIDASAFVAPTAAVIGNVTVGPDSGIWYHCVLRGDTAAITIGARTNIQDGTIIHVNPDMPTVIGDDVTVGHAAIIHACTLESRAFVAMGATVLDGAVIEGGGMLAAGALLTPNKRIRAGELWAGSPAKLLRVLSEEDAARFARTAVSYVGLARAHRGH